ncbi:MAG: chromosomal replication initiator protein DnaA [Bacteroidales bacterium]|jgi:chromosomal replication initiator protein|nr:chromosomal replication initiator protein DnaA [Bacteroidales bacterium]
MKEKVSDCQIIWNECLKIIKENISSQSFETWFIPIKPISLSNYVLTIEVPSMFYHEFIEGNYWELLKTAIKKVLGINGKLEYKIPISISDKEGEKSSMTLPTSTINALESQSTNPIFIESEKEVRQIPNPFVLPGIKKLNIKSQLNKNLNFDNFIEGDCNRLARAAGYAIAKNPGKTAFNPLFIYSSVGLGKTHLAHAIGLETKAQFPELTVLYVNAETFLQQYVEAGFAKNINDFVHFYQMLDVLIIDDVEFLATKPKTQEVFFHIFNFYHQKNKQLVITSDKSPAEMVGFEQRLLSRFKWGLSADLQVPDKDTRMKIIRSKLYNNGIEDIDEEVIEYLAYRIVTNVREIEGAIISILAQASLNKKQITVELAKQMIDKFVQNTVHEMSIDYIQKVVCDYYNMPVNQIFSTSRKRDIVHVRHSSMYFAKKYTDMSLSQIGTKCGNKDHATVLHACRAIENLIATDKKIKEDLNNIDKILKNS